MKKIYRVKKKSEIDAIFNNKKQLGNSYFSIFYKGNEFNHFRFGLSIGRKYGNSVSRNKIKRQVRSIMRLNQELINKAFDFIIVIKPKANTLTYEQISNEIISLLKKLKIMEIKHEKNK